MDASYCDIFAVRFAPESKESEESVERILRIRVICNHNPKNLRESKESRERTRRIWKRSQRIRMRSQRIRRENPKNPEENPKTRERTWRIREAEFKESVHTFFICLVSNIAGTWHCYHITLIHRCMNWMPNIPSDHSVCTVRNNQATEDLVGMLFHWLSELIVSLHFEYKFTNTVELCVVLPKS